MDKKRVSRLSVEVFLSQVAENIVGEPFCVSEMVWYLKFLDNRGITILPNFFVLHRQNSSWANRSVFQIYTGIKMFWTTGVRRFCSFVLSLNVEKFRSRNPVFRKSSGIEKFMDNKLSPFRWIFLSHVAENHRGRTLLCFRIVLASKTFWIIGVTEFCRIFLSHIAKNHRGRTRLCFRNVLASKVFWTIRVSQLCLIFFCLTSPKIIVGEPVCVSEILWFHNFLDNSSVLLLSIVFVSQCRKFS